MLPGSKELLAECGLWRENAAWVKGLGGGVWLVARKRRLGQESRWRSVACGEKTPRGSRKPVVQYGLWRENAAWVKKAGGGVWLVARKRCVGQEGRWRSVVKKAGDAVWLVARKRRVGQRTWRRSVV